MNVLKRHFFIFTIIGTFFVLGAILNISCPIMYLIKIPCPTCGMTRAILSLVRFDIKGYMAYNPMAFFMITAAFFLIHRNILGRKKWIDIYSAIVLTTNLIFYFMRNI